MKAVALFPILDVISYLFQGFLLFFSVCTFFQPELAVAVVAATMDDAFTPVLLMLIVCYTIGQANSSLSHLVLQQCLTRLAFGRPSRYFLGFLKPRPDLTVWGRKTAPLRRVGRRALSVLWKPFIPRERKAIAAWAAREGYTLTTPRLDANIFSRAFNHLTFAEKKPEVFDIILFNYNFSRNMATALLISVTFFWITPQPMELEILKAMFGPDSGVTPTEAMVAQAHWLMLATFILVFFRFVYFFGVYTKTVLRYFILEAKAEEAEATDESAPAPAVTNIIHLHERGAGAAVRRDRADDAATRLVWALRRAGGPE